MLRLQYCAFTKHIFSCSVLLVLSLAHGFALPVVSRKADLHEYLTVLYNGHMSLRLGM